jgi:hypothetical protein
MRAVPLGQGIFLRLLIGAISVVFVGAIMVGHTVAAFGSLGALAVALSSDRRHQAKLLHGYRRRRRAKSRS